MGFASDDAEPVSLVRARQENEADFLRRALAAIADLIDSGCIIGGDGQRWPIEPFFICHNAPFDLGFLMRRCWVNGIRPPFPLPAPTARVGKDYGDTMTLWAGYRNTIGLDRLCCALAIPSPKAEGIDGSQILDLWLTDKVDSIRRYNLKFRPLATAIAATSLCFF